MKKLHIEATINAPVNTCWEAWTDVSVANKWLGTTHVGTTVGDDYRISQLIPYLTGRHQILEIDPEKKLKLQFFIDGWPGELTVNFSEVTVNKKAATKLVLDFTVETKNAPQHIEPLHESRDVFYFIGGSWNHVLCNLRSLLEDKTTGVIMAPQNNDHVINLHIDIKSTPEKLYRALTNVEELRNHIGEGFITKDAEIDPKVGGKYCYGWYPKNTPDKDRHDGPNKLLKLEKNKLVVHDWYGGLKIAEISWKLEDKGNGITRLTFKHSPLLGHTHGNVWSYRSGWSECLHDLKWHAERGETSRCWIKNNRFPN